MSGKSPGPQIAPATGVVAKLSNKIAEFWGPPKGKEYTEDLATEVVDQVGTVVSLVVLDELDCPPPKRQRTVERITPKKSGNTISNNLQSRAQIYPAPGQLDTSPDEWRFSPCHADNVIALPQYGPNRKSISMPSQVTGGFQFRNTLSQKPHSTRPSNSVRHTGIFNKYSNKRPHKELEMEIVSGANVPSKAFDLQGASAEDRKFKKPRIALNSDSQGSAHRLRDDDGDLKVLGDNMRAPFNSFDSPRKPSDTPSSISHGSVRGLRKSQSFGEIKEYRVLENLIAPRKSRSPLCRTQSNGNRFSEINGNGDIQNIGTYHASSTSIPEKQQVTIDLSDDDSHLKEPSVPWKGTANLRVPRDKDRRNKINAKLSSSLRHPNSATVSKHLPVNKVQEILAGSTREEMRQLQARGNLTPVTRNLRDNFHRTDESPDELQDETPTDKSRRAQDYQISAAKEMPSSSNDIGSSQFYSSSGCADVDTKPTISSRAKKNKFDQQKLRLKRFRTGNSELSQPPEYHLVFDVPSSDLSIYKEERNWTEKYPHLKVDPKKLNKALWATGESCKIQLMASKDTRVNDNKFDIELFSHKDVVDFVNTLQTIAPMCKVHSRSSGDMDKIFEQRAIEKVERENRKPATSSAPGKSLSRADLADIRIQKAQRHAQTSNQRPSRISDFVAKSSPDHLESVSESILRAEQVTPAKPDEEVRGRRTRTRASTGKNSNICQSLSPEPEEVPQVERYSRKVGFGKPWLNPLIYPAQGPKRATVEFRDLDRLDEGQFLNDNLISFYLRFLEHHLEQNNPEIAKKIYFFNTYFYASLSKPAKGQRINYELVQRWTSKVDIFTYDFVIVPINENAHWYLAIICNLPRLPRTFHKGDTRSSSAIPILDGASEVPEPQADMSEPAKDDVDAMLESDTEIDEAEEQVSRMSLSRDGLDRLPKPIVADDGAASECASSDHADADELSKYDLDPSGNPSFAETSTGIRPTKNDSIPNPTRKITNNTQLEHEPDVQANPSKKTKDPSLPRIITLDSLGLPHPVTAKNLKEYLVLEGKSKRNFDVQRKEIPAMTVKDIPLQENYCDCGLFLLGYVAKFLQEPHEFVRKGLRKEYDVSKDWPQMDASEMRTNIRNMIMDLQREQAGEKRGTINSKPTAELIATDKSKLAENTNTIVAGNGVSITTKLTKGATEPKERKLTKRSPEMSGGTTRADALERASRIDESVLPSANLAVPWQPINGKGDVIQSKESKAASKMLCDDTPIMTDERPVKKKKRRSVQPENKSDTMTLDVEDDLPAEVPCSPSHSPSREHRRVRKSPKRSPLISESARRQSPLL
ncbi:MAG: hypothetical protein M1812_001446 [Candelaria pacifica]|nr:MAG: hypothetical protein M1812_001446 [Candelaria pacifica]